jgi:GTP-binding protein
MNKSIRNIAIIAHVDHGKTTLVDAMLKQSNTFAAHQEVSERVMDSMDLEREKGITIRAKNASLLYQDTKINLIDTPGHADFGGEVERVLSMVDGALLLVDAKEGPKPQTKFVLKHALSLGLRVIVVINKIDRPDARIDDVIDQTFDLFSELGANDHQLDFPIVYASAINGQAYTELDEPRDDVKELFEVIVNEVSAPTAVHSDPMKILVTNIAYDQFKGKMAVGKIAGGEITKGAFLKHFGKEGEKSKKITAILQYQGMVPVEVEKGVAGDIAIFAGIEDVSIGDTIASQEVEKPFERIHVEEPTLRMIFQVNDSPFSGTEGKAMTSRTLKERLERELETNISLKVEDTDSPERFLVSGRGELHLAILIETMRREGYEFAVGSPEVVTRTNEQGQLEEPYEQVIIEVPEDFQGKIIETLNKRQGEFVDMKPLATGDTQIEYVIPMQQMIGMRNILLTLSKGQAIINTSFAKFDTKVSKGRGRSTGSIVSLESGKITKYALFNAQDRGEFFIGDGVEVYPGMVLGEANKEFDIEINPVKAKKLTNMRASGSDDNMVIAPPKDMSLEECIEYIARDELLEVTPESLRIRKKILDVNERKKQSRREKTEG